MQKLNKTLYLIGYVLVLLAILGLSACVSSKQKRLENATQLNKKQVIQLFSGKTKAAKRDWGSWVHYFKDQSLNGVGGAMFNDGRIEKSKAIASLSDDGELCYSFTGGPKWAAPNNKNCEKYYIDQQGKYFGITTVDWKGREGRVLNFEVKDGNPYGLN